MANLRARLARIPASRHYMASLRAGLARIPHHARTWLALNITFGGDPGASYTCRDEA